MKAFDLQPPYFAHTEGLPGIDFSREILKPGECEDFPDGALGIRVDDDFWSVAALPLKYADVPLADIVKNLWPQYADEATLCPDHGTAEQRVYQAEGWAKSVESMNSHLNKEVRRLCNELARLRSPRPGLGERIVNRHRAESDYFVRQYEHLLVAVAHPSEPMERRGGVCARCGLSISDRVHMKHYIDLHDAGYEPSMKHLLEFD